MFSEVSLDVTSIDSTWKSEREFADQTTQTVEITTKDKSCRTQPVTETPTQTTSIGNTHMGTLSAIEEANLAKWLNSIYPKVVTELERDSSCRAFRKLSTKEDSSTKSTQCPQDEGDKIWNEFLSLENEKAIHNDEDFKKTLD